MYVWSIIGVAVFYLAQNAVVSASIKEKEGGIVYQPRHLLRASVIARQKAVSIDEGKAPLPPGFKYIYVTNNGSLVNSSGAPGDTIEVSGSPKTQMRSVRMAASTVARMVKKMPQAIFRRISRDAGVGVFTAEEKIIIYPSFADLKNGDCGTNCTGDCEKTCTFDGRKYEDIGAAAGERAAIEEDSVMCGVTFNTFELIDVVSHEFGHTAMMYGMSDTQ
ncbi:uncharacterized protein LOC101860720 [Aplysia californica]|uniref:Uncharacterized protein LOC101860720 n=1 Tax=Aplysia californica TaxID=6500 RepID=A0ABM0JEB4_APLCA|nr:uncharacterized protein LOC101860720 [Aplysia californica]